MLLQNFYGIEILMCSLMLFTKLLWDWGTKILGLGLLGIGLGRPFRNGKFVGEDIIRCPFISNGKLMKFGSITCQGPSRVVSLPFVVDTIRNLDGKRAFTKLL